MNNKVAALCVAALLSGTIVGCQSTSTTSGTLSQESSSIAETEDSEDSVQSSVEYSYQGVTIYGNAGWTASQPNEYEYYIQVNNPSHCSISVRTALHGQTESLSSAWAEYTTAVDSPVVTDSWENAGINYSAGYYNDNYMMVSGCDQSTGKGFLLLVALSNGDRTDSAAEELFDGIANSISYDPSQTSVDYKEAFAADHQTEESSDSGYEDAAASSQYGEGTYKVGVDIPAGEYRLTATSDNAYWEVTESSAADADIVGNDVFDGSTYVTVSDGQYLKLRRCYAEPVE